MKGLQRVDKKMNDYIETVEALCKTKWRKGMTHPIVYNNDQYTRG